VELAAKRKHKAASAMEAADRKTKDLEREVATAKEVRDTIALRCVSTFGFVHRVLLRTLCHRHSDGVQM
jgi:hypothetical protein